MRNFLVFRPNVGNNIESLDVCGLVKGQTAEHAIRTAKTRGFLSPIVQEKPAKEKMDVELGETKDPANHRGRATGAGRV